MTGQDRGFLSHTCSACPACRGDPDSPRRGPAPGLGARDTPATAAAHAHIPAPTSAHTAAVPVTSFCTHIPVCMPPSPGSRLVLQPWGLLGWLVAPCHPLLTSCRHQRAHAPPTAPEPTAPSSCPAGGGHGTPYLWSLTDPALQDRPKASPHRAGRWWPPPPSQSGDRPLFDPPPAAIPPSMGFSCYPGLSPSRSDAVGELG